MTPPGSPNDESDDRDRGEDRRSSGGQGQGPTVRVIRRGRRTRSRSPRPRKRQRPSILERVRAFLRELPTTLRREIPRWRAWAREHLDRRHYTVAASLLTLLGWWWWFAPWWTAHQAVEALERGDRTAFEARAEIDTVLSRFFDEWASQNARLPENGTPRAISLSVKPEVVRQIRHMYERTLDRGPGGGWVLEGYDLGTGLRQRVFVPGRDVRVTVAGPAGQERAAWFRLQMDGLRWTIVGAPGAVDALDFILSRPSD